MIAKSARMRWSTNPKNEKSVKNKFITVVVFLQSKSWSFVHWLTGFFGGKIQWIRKYKFRGRSACLYSHCLCFGICPVIAKFARMRWSADPKKQGSGKSTVCWWLWFFNVILSDFSYCFHIHSDAVVDDSQTSLLDEKMLSCTDSLFGVLSYVCAVCSNVMGDWFKDRDLRILVS